eukprot:TRINITY_DN54023_c0_g1_i1.p1 TRINITY_DN54023_c0_g1~~TRINITY_DN54023_c0_g1_i1.p1  ORF type:complete len:290 (-),score=16.77 TRINITY_DN54023_c0_g1_i1:17-886(-)
MKKKSLLFTLLAGMTYVTLSSSTNGAAADGNGDRTGRLGSSVTCGASGCHAGGAGTTTCAIEIRKKSAPTGAIVTTYDADSVYIVKVTGTNPTTTLTKYGFQIICVNGVGGTSNVGTWQNLPSGTKSTSNASTSSLALIEQSSPQARNSSNNYEVSLEWKAPTSGAATFYAIINAVNNSNTVGGDAVSSSTQVTLQKSASVSNTNLEAAVSVYPNPATDVITIDAKNITSGDVLVQVSDLRGKIIATQTANANSNAMNTSINCSRWAAGMYYISISKGAETKVVPVVKH